MPTTRPALALAVSAAALAAVLVAAQPPRPVLPPPKPEGGFDIRDWTPRPAVGKGEPWEKMKDPDWDDARFRAMDTGPFFDCTLRYAHGKDSVLAYKATAVRLGDNAGYVFDRNTLSVGAAWVGGYLQHSNRRFGLLNTPTPVGKYVHSMPAGPGWGGPHGAATPAGKHTGPLPDTWAKYRGLYVHGDRVVFSYYVGDVAILDAARAVDGAVVRTVHVRSSSDGLTARSHADAVTAIPPNRQPKAYAITYGPAPADAAPDDLPALTKPGPKRWGEPLVTKLVRGADAGPFAVDTFTVPYDNRHKALFFCTGLDFLPDGRIAVCTCHGDVWLVTENGETCSWQRYATGLYHPLGLKVVDGKVIVLERGQLTRLHDNNSDGEADFYECVNNDWHTGSGEHSYDTCLETDPAGNFYFFKTGDTDTPTGGVVMRVSKDGAKSEIFCTGFRHPIGMGMSPTGIVTGADQEGNWMPATRIDQYKFGGFYGDMRAHHRATPPATYDGPLCWLPREVDNSAGGQVWVPEGTFGPLAGLPLHFSYGRCRPFVLLRQEVGGFVQGGVAALPVSFLSGVCRGRFRGGALYVCGLNGWQTSAQTDGCLQRVRYTGKPLDVPVQFAATTDGVTLTFSRPLDPATAAIPANYKVAWWNYRWAAEYGSKRYRPSAPDVVGQDEVSVTSATVSADGRTVYLKLAGMRPVMQIQIGYNVTAPDAAAVTGSVFGTVHALAAVR